MRKLTTSINTTYPKQQNSVKVYLIVLLTNKSEACRKLSPVLA